MPEVAVAILPILQTGFGPGMSEVDEKDKTEHNEYCCTDESDVVAPEHKETIRDEEGDDDKNDPEKDLGAPPSVLDSGTFVLGVLHTDKEGTYKEMEQRQGEAYPMNLGGYKSTL